MQILVCVCVCVWERETIHRRRIKVTCRSSQKRWNKVVTKFGNLNWSQLGSCQEESEDRQKGKLVVSLPTVQRLRFLLAQHAFVSVAAIMTRKEQSPSFFCRTHSTQSRCHCCSTSAVGCRVRNAAVRNMVHPSRSLSYYRSIASRFPKVIRQLLTPSFSSSCFFYLSSTTCFRTQFWAITDQSTYLPCPLLYLEYSDTSANEWPC